MRLTIPTAQIVMIERIKIPFCPAPPGVDPWLHFRFPQPSLATTCISWHPLPRALACRLTSQSISGWPLFANDDHSFCKHGTEGTPPPSRNSYAGLPGENLNCKVSWLFFFLCVCVLVILYLKSRWKVKSVTNP